MPYSIYDNGGYVGYTTQYSRPSVAIPAENGLTLTSTFTESSNISSSLFSRTLNAVFACDITFPSIFNSDGLIFECGATQIGTVVGLTNSGTTLRFAAGDGGSPPVASQTALLDIPTTTFVPGSSGTLVWDYQINPGRVRSWWNDIFLGEAFTDGAGPLDTNSWAGTNNGVYLLGAAANVPLTLNGTSAAAAWPGTAQSSLRYYSGQLVDAANVSPTSSGSSGIWSLASVLETLGS
jgi:hypothetical protein